MKAIRSLTMLMLSVSAFALIACAGQTSLEKEHPEAARAVKTRVKNTPPTANAMRTGSEAVFESTSLSETQKDRLKELYGDNSKEQDRINKDLGKNKAALMKLLVSADAKDTEIEILKNRILELEREKSSLFMSTLDQAEGILGRKDQQNERFYRAFLVNPTDPDILP
jgi:Spy/CpxP family protein refolding chaperone